MTNLFHFVSNPCLVKNPLKNCLSLILNSSRFSRDNFMKLILVARNLLTLRVSPPGRFVVLVTTNIAKVTTNANKRQQTEIG